MKFTKNKINEIINSNDELIGSDAIPKNGSDLESQSNGTTDMNVSKSAQPFRYDMLGRFGFTLLPFFEGKENKEQTELIQDLSTYIYDRYKKILEYYYRNPNKLKSDFRKLSNNEKVSNEILGSTSVKEIIKIVEKHFENAFKTNIDESEVHEDKVVNDKTENELSKKTEDSDIKSKRIEKIAGLIGKLNKNDVDKLINLLERK